MKPSFIYALTLGGGLALLGCSDDTSSPPISSGGGSGELEAGVGGADGGKGGGLPIGGSPRSGAPGAEAGEAGASPLPEGGEGGEAGSGNEVAAWYSCQASDQAFVRRAILGVLGRRAYSQAEVNVYTQIIQQIDAADGLSEEQKLAKPETALRHSRQVVLE